MAKRAEGCRLLHLAKRTSSGGLISYAKSIAIVGLEDISITLRELSNELEAFIMGKKYENGKKVTSVSDSAPSLALLYQQTNSDGTYTNRVLYNCTLARDEVSNKTTTDSISFDSVKLSGKAIPLEDGNLDLIMESDDVDVDAEELANFFEKVVMP